MTSLTLCSLSMRRTFWQGITSRAECAKLSASSSFERSSFSFMDFANIPRLCLYVYYVIYMYTHTRWSYAHVCMYMRMHIHMHTCRYVFSCFPTQWRLKSNPVASHRALRLHTVSELRRKKSKGCELEMTWPEMLYFSFDWVITNWWITIRTLRLCSIYRRHVNTWIFAKNCVERKAFSLCETQFVQSATRPRVRAPNSIALRAFTLTFQVSMYQICISLSMIFNTRKKHGKSHRTLSGIFFLYLKKSDTW